MYVALIEYILGLRERISLTMNILTYCSMYIHSHVQNLNHRSFEFYIRLVLNVFSLLKTILNFTTKRACKNITGVNHLAF